MEMGRDDDLASFKEFPSAHSNDKFVFVRNPPIQDGTG